MSPAAGTGVVPRPVLSEADGAGTGNQGNTRFAGQRTVQGDHLVAYQLPVFDAAPGHFRLYDTGHFPVADTGGADAKRTAMTHSVQIGAKLPQQRGESFRADAVHIEGAEHRSIQHLSLRRGADYLGLGAAAVYSCNKVHPFFLSSYSR